MAPKASSTLLSLAIFLVFSATATTALNITRILKPYPAYSKFAELVNQTGINDMTKSREVITILALDNDSMESISGRPEDELKRILMSHIVLDYYDTLKIQKLDRKTQLLTNLYQTTGYSEDKQGYLNMTKISPGDVVFGSAVKGSPLVAKLLGSVLASPFNISVIHVSTPIVPTGIGEAVLPPPPPPGSPPPAPAPNSAEAPAPAEFADDSDDDSNTPSPSPSPAAHAPAKSKQKSPPAPDADEEAPAPSGAWRACSSAGIAVITGLIVSLVVF